MTHAIKEWVNGLGRSLQIYLPVHMLPALFFRFQQLKDAPVALTAKISFAALCSSAFLTSYQVRKTLGDSCRCFRDGIAVCLTVHPLRNDS